jgi:hypothetical protein
LRATRSSFLSHAKYPSPTGAHTIQASEGASLMPGFDVVHGLSR